MPTVHFTSELQRFTGESEVTVSATNYRELISELKEIYSSLPIDELLKMAIAIDGEIIHDPFLEEIDPLSEVHFIFRISGG